MTGPVYLPPTDPGASYRAHRAEIDAALREVLDSGRYVLGDAVRRFEAAFAQYLGVPETAAVGSGTDALQLALKACGITACDTVFTVSHTAVATVAAIALVGARAVLVDIDPATFTIDPGKLEDALRRAPAGGRRAVIAVHLYGHPADLSALQELAARHDVVLLEDCAQSHGASWQGRRTGSVGTAASFSFYPTKNLGALGDGGAVASPDAAVAATVRRLREYGWRQRYVSEAVGMNSRLDEIQAAVCTVKLRHLDDDNAVRARLAALYSNLLESSGLILPSVRRDATHAWHQYVVRCGSRDRLREHLDAAGIGTLVHYPVPVHRQPAYAGRLAIAPSGLDETERAAGEVLSLPMHAQLDADAVHRVATAILGGLGGSA